MAKYDEIAIALDERLKAMTNLPSIVQFENTSVTTPEDELSLESFLLPSETTHTTLGENAPGNESGVYQINVVSKTDVGRGYAMELSQKVREHFKRGTVLQKNNTFVRIVKATLSKGKSDGTKYKIPVSAYYISIS